MLRRLHKLFLRWMRDDASLMSAAMAYYAVLSMFPLLLILTSGLGFFLHATHTGQDARQFILTAIAEQLSPVLADHVRVALDQVQANAGFNGPIGFVTLLIAAMAMFAQFERAFDRIWNVESNQHRTFVETIKRVATHRLRAFVMLVGVGVAIIVVFFAGMAVKAFHAYAHARITDVAWFWWSIETFLILALNATVFALLYKFLPKASVRWLHALRGGLFSAICWELGRQILATFVIGQRYTNAYGLLGSLLAIMLWAYYSFGVIFLGAEYTQLLGEESGADPSVDTENGLGKNLHWGETMMFSLLLYVATFLALRHFQSHQLPNYHPDKHVIVFSPTRDGQQWCQLIFAPLIATLPGNYYYPSASEIPSVLQHLQTAQANPTVEQETTKWR